MPAITVVVPIYNVGPWLAQCLASLEAQTIPLAVVLVVRPSADGSDAIALRFAGANGWGYVEQTGVGLSDARNVGLALAATEYVAFIDSDDWLDPGMFAALLQRAQSDRSDIVLGDYRHMDSAPCPDTTCRRAMRIRTGSFGWRDDPRVFLLEPAVYRRLYRREFLTRLGFRWLSIFGEDVIAHFELPLRGAIMSLEDRAIYHYRAGRPGSLIGLSSFSVPDLFVTWNRLSRVLAELAAPPVVWAAAVRYLVRHIPSFHARLSAHRALLFACMQHALASLPQEVLRTYFACFPSTVENELLRRTIAGTGLAYYQANAAAVSRYVHWYGRFADPLYMKGGVR